METKDILKKLRNDKGETLSELSQKVGISQPTLSRYEKGTRKPKYDQLERLAAHFSVTIDYLAGKSDDPQMPAKKGPVAKFVSSFAPSFGVYP
ncbi:MAG: helix-turn-helix domain-containing protein, partial [Weissella confusa]